MDAGMRLAQFVQTLDNPPPVYFRHFPEMLGDCLKAWHDPLCIIEHEHDITDLNQGEDGLRALALPAMPTDRILKAYDLIRELVPLSPSTKFLVTCHVRGSGVGPERAIYKTIPEVVRVFGFLNSTTAQNYLLKFTERHWQSKRKSPEEIAKWFQRRQEANHQIHLEFERRREAREA
jgi:hypothetical protein